jgi:DNA-binding transcriptional ArsR family regulator
MSRLERQVVFSALADENRRALLDKLRMRNGQTLAELCDGMAITRQAVTKHLAVLEEAALILAIRKGRVKLHFLNPVPLNATAMRWLKLFDDVTMDRLIPETTGEPPKGR